MFFVYMAVFIRYFVRITNPRLCCVGFQIRHNGGKKLCLMSIFNVYCTMAGFVLFRRTTNPHNACMPQSALWHFAVITACALTH